MNKKNRPVYAPALSFGNDQYKITKWHKKNHDLVKVNDIIATGETAKAAFEIYSPYNGNLKIKVTKSEFNLFSQPIAYIQTSSSNKNINKADHSDIKENSKVTAKAQKLLLKYGININQINNKNTITEAVVNEYLKNIGINNLFEIRPLTPNQLAMGESLEQLNRPIGYVSIRCASTDIPNETTSFSNTTSLAEAILYATIQSLKKYKELNSTVVDKEIKVFSNINIGYAMNFNNLGLKMPVIRLCERKNLDSIKAGLSDLKLNYLRNELKHLDFVGATFAITDLSSYKTDVFIPNLPKSFSAILGVSSVNESDNKFHLSMSFDHRVCDGAYATIFLKEIERILSNFKNVI